MKSATLIAVFLVLGLSGCAARIEKADSPAPLRVDAAASKKLVLSLDGSEVATSSGNWEEMKGVWRDAFGQEATSAGVAYGFQEGAAQHTGEEGTLLVVYVNDYR
jgi:hypothetical protein